MRHAEETCLHFTEFRQLSQTSPLRAEGPIILPYHLGILKQLGTASRDPVDAASQVRGLQVPDPPGALHDFLCRVLFALISALEL